MKKRNVCIGLLCIFLLALTSTVWAGGGQPSGTAGSAGTSGYQWPRTITMLGAGAGGNGHTAISTIAQVISKHAPTTVSAQVTAGGLQNIFLMDVGEGTYAWGSAYQTNNAYNNLDNFINNPVEIRPLMVNEFSTTISQFAVRRGSGIRTLQDLRGKRVSVGPASGGLESTVRRFMRSVGLHDGTNYQFTAHYLDAQQSVDMLSNGQLDAILQAGSLPNVPFVELFITDRIELIGLTDSELRAFTNEIPAYARTIIPAGSYEGKVPADLVTVMLRDGLIVDPKVPDEEVYNVVKIMHENWDELGIIFNLFAQQKPENMVPVTDLIPTHPGAVKYYREQGWIR